MFFLLFKKILKRREEEIFSYLIKATETIIQKVIRKIRSRKFLKDDDRSGANCQFTDLRNKILNSEKERTYFNFTFEVR